MKKIIFLSAVFALLFSCNFGDKKASDATSDTLESGQSMGNKSSNCLKKYEDDYAQLLTKEEMSSVHSIDFEEAQETLTSGDYGEHMYSWPSDRPSFTVEANGMKMEMPDKNIMGIKNLSFYSGDLDSKAIVNTFDRGYKELSEKELSEIDDKLKKVKDDEVKKTGTDMMEVRKKINFDFVDHIGTSAWYRWNDNYGGELAVLGGIASFTVVVKINEDPDENLDIARKLAEIVLQKCR